VKIHQLDAKVVSDKFRLKLIVHSQVHKSAVVKALALGGYPWVETWSRIWRTKDPQFGGLVEKMCI